MTPRDWDFAFGSLGDPLADIKDWMIPPYPKWRIKHSKEVAIGETKTKRMSRNP